MTIYYIENVDEYCNISAVECLLYVNFREYIDKEQKQYTFDYKKIWEYLLQNEKIFSDVFDIKIAFLFFYRTNENSDNKEVNFRFEGNKLIELKKEDFDKADTLEESKHCKKQREFRIKHYPY